MRDKSLSYYRELYNTMIPLPGSAGAIQAAVNAVLRGHDAYAQVEVDLVIPWRIVGVLHLMEASCNMKQNLLNGQPLSQRTTIAPVGHGPWGTWEEMASMILSNQSWRFPEMWNVPNTLRFFEQWNGWGYSRQRVNSPYLWAGSNHGVGVGKYVGELAGVPARYDPAFVSDQIGAAVALRELGF